MLPVFFHTEEITTASRKEHEVRVRDPTGRGNSVLYAAERSH